MMINKELILKRINSIDDKLLVAKILDKASKSEHANNFIHSDFLDPHQKNVVEKALAGNEEIDYTFSGGYTGAERVVIIFRPYFMPEEVEHDPEDFFKVIRVSLATRENLTHRDYLGALIGLGIKREKIGDILVKEESCDIIVLGDIAQFISLNLVKVGSAKVSVEIKCITEVEGLEPKVKEINSTVASLRLDSVASAGFGISRSKIAEFIKSDKVNLNWEATPSLTRQVKEGDTISIRGRGRVVLEKISGTTKKGRISVTLKKFV